MSWQGSVLPNVYEERSTSTLRGRRLFVRNTFIDVEDDSQYPRLFDECHVRVVRSLSAPRSPPGAVDDSVGQARPGVFGANCSLRQDGGVLRPACKGSGLEDDALSIVSTVTGSKVARSGQYSDSEPADESVEDSDVPKTTVMLRNLPGEFTREMLVHILNTHGFKGRFDYVYLPLHFTLRTSFGYAFINLVNSDEAERFWNHFEGFRFWPMPSDKVATVRWSDALQGLHEQVERFRNSRIMHESMPDELKPAVFAPTTGVRLPFPPPTKQLRPPRKRLVSKKGPLEGDA